MRNNLNEIPIFLCCLWSGLLLGILYDIFRIPRKLNNKFITAFFDLLFGIAALCLSALTLLYCDDGALRLFTLSGIAAGAIIWQTLPGRLIRSLFAKIGAHVRRKTRE